MMSGSENKDALDRFLALEHLLRREMEGNASIMEAVFKAKKMEYERLREMYEALPRDIDKHWLEVYRKGRPEHREAIPDVLDINIVARAAGLVLVLAGILTWSTDMFGISFPPLMREIISTALGVVAVSYGIWNRKERSGEES